MLYPSSFGFYALVTLLAIIQFIMRSSWLFLLVSSVTSNYDFSALVNHIQKSTFDFDKRIQDTKNSEEASIENIELQERNVDRELDSIRQKFHLRPVSSFLQKQNDDAKLIRDSELAREQAEEDMINVEEQIANIPKQLFPLRTR